MVQFGMTPLQAIRSATVVNARLFGIDKDVGVLKPGYFADLIAVDGDPLQDVAVLENVGFVMKQGRVYKNAANE
jgi:imidazolonepropionase-like amidohydrolase